MSTTTDERRTAARERLGRELMSAADRFSSRRARRRRTVRAAALSVCLTGTLTGVGLASGVLPQGVLQGFQEAASHATNPAVSGVELDGATEVASLAGGTAIYRATTADGFCTTEVVSGRARGGALCFSGHGPSSDVTALREDDGQLVILGFNTFPGAERLLVGTSPNETSIPIGPHGWFIHRLSQNELSPGEHPMRVVDANDRTVDPVGDNTGLLDIPGPYSP